MIKQQERYKTDEIFKVCRKLTDQNLGVYDGHFFILLHLNLI